MAHYSMVVISRCPVSFVDPLVLLDTGRNVFTAQVRDIVAFRQALKDEGCVLVCEYPLDASLDEQKVAAQNLLVPSMLDGSQRLPAPPKCPSALSAHKPKAG